MYDKENAQKAGFDQNHFNGKETSAASSANVSLDFFGWYLPGSRNCSALGTSAESSLVITGLAQILVSRREAMQIGRASGRERV